MIFKKAASLGILFCLFIPFVTSSAVRMITAQALAVDAYSYAGAVTSCEISGDSVVIKGKVNMSQISGATALNTYELPIYQDEKTANYASLTPVATVKTAAIPSSGSFSFSIARSKIKSIASKFVLRLSNQKLLDCAKYITNPGALAVNKDPYPSSKSIKGLQVQINSDAERLGVQHAAINVTLNSMLTLSDHGGASIPYTFNGKKYYFVRDYIESLDATFAPLSNNHIVVNAILLLPGCDLSDPDAPNKDLVHPDAKSSMSNYIINAVNLTNQAGVEYYTAILTFLSQRYNGSNRNYGTINGYIVGNEIGMRTYNNMGDKTVEEYSLQYERQLRLTNTIVKQARSSARVYVSLEHFWAITYYDFVNKQLIDLINTYSKKGGDYDWNIAFHPYPDDLSDPKTWNDSNTTDSFNTVKINFKNLQVLPRYLKQTEQLYNGRPRRIILSEEGFNTPDDSIESQKIQAAAYAYAYYKAVSIPEVDAFILHRHVDHTQEAGLKLGLWDTLGGYVVQPGSEKLIYNVFKNIDTVDSKKVTDFALRVISENNTANRTYTGWKQLIAEYSDATIAAKCNRPVVLFADSGIAMNVTGVAKIGNSSFTEWYATDNTASPSVVKDAAGSYLKARPTGVSMKEYKGFTFEPASAINLKNKPILMADVMVTGFEDSEADIMIRVYSKDKVAEDITLAPVGKWSTICVDLSKFPGIQSIDRIKVWARPNDDILWSTGFIGVKNLAAASAAVVSPSSGKTVSGGTGSKSETTFGGTSSSIASTAQNSSVEQSQAASAESQNSGVSSKAAASALPKRPFPLLAVLIAAVILAVGAGVFAYKKLR